MSEGLKFGTSGLRGLVTELTGFPAYSYALAFCRMLREESILAAGDTVLVGRDLRASSFEIARLCLAAVQAAGLRAVECGALPTPALALAALERPGAAIMVTGSHIPEDRNGLKFYRPQGEITKADESGIAHRQAGIGLIGTPPAAAGLVETLDAVAPYLRRYVNFFATGSLSGLTVGVYQHSSVARDIVGQALASAGARVMPLGRADRFVPVDTEALRPEDVSLAAGWATEFDLDAIVSTDGDADRPLLADEAGAFLRGDLVGLLTARYLGCGTVVTPVTSNSAIERSGFAQVRRTRVGSPFVIAGMEAAVAAGEPGVIGFEANGGVLLGSAAYRDGRMLAALPTRDALLPILAVLAAARSAGKPLSALVAELHASAAAAHRLKDVSAQASGAFLRKLESEPSFRDAFFREVGKVLDTGTLDGLRFSLSGGRTVHYRASGNAPELRCYVEAPTQAQAESLLDWGLGAARRALA